MPRNSRVTGKISSSQLIGIFGIGALYDLRAYSKKSQTVTSVIVGGLDEWDLHRKDLRRISEPALQHALRVRSFYAPPPSPDDAALRRAFTGPYVPVHRFPAWMVCSLCQRMGVAGREFDDRQPGNSCLASKCRGHGVPVRLVATCFPGPGMDASGPHPGHIEEFPWHAWAHSRSPQSNCSSDDPQLKLERSGRSAALSGLRVICLKPECREKNIWRSLDGAFGANALHSHQCTGSRPWIRDHEPCGRPIRALMRGASNVYFPVTASALSIPPNSSACLQGVADVWRMFTPTLDAHGGLDAMQPKMAAEIVMNANGRLRRYSHDQVFAAIRTLASPGPLSADDLPDTSAEQRVLERNAIVEGRSDEDTSGVSIFEAQPVPRAQIEKEASHASDVIDALVLLHRLREVRALRGFQRLHPLGGGDPYSIPCAPLSPKTLDWLPAIEVYGEGVYFELERNRLDEWSRRPEVKARVSRLQAKRHASSSVGGDGALTPQFLLVHTLTHLLINQLALDCGYSSSSLRERIYVGANDRGEGWAGALIYTATTSADGTLGGLVRQGRPDLFGKTLQAAVENATWCSSDPLCIESKGQGVDALNLAACHACAIVSETSCEHRNLLLDRALVIGTPDHPEIGFFLGTALLDAGG